jgi:hypothetical protein
MYENKKEGLCGKKPVYGDIAMNGGVRIPPPALFINKLYGGLTPTQHI